MHFTTCFDERKRKAVAIHLGVDEEDVLHIESEDGKRGNSDLFVMVRKGKVDEIVNIIVGKNTNEFVERILRDLAACV